MLETEAVRELQSTGKEKLSASTSLFLDILRILAACIVFAVHFLHLLQFPLGDASGRLGQGAVIVFFVLSGFVIAYSTNAMSTGRKYVVSRLSRLYSVVAPALVLTAVLLFVGERINPSAYSAVLRGSEWPRLALSAVFLQNSLKFSAAPTTNGPFWSLSYEFWYYCLFGAFLFIRAKWLKYAGLALIAILICPNILLLLPCWLAGVVAFRLSKRLSFAVWTASAGFFLASLASICAFAFSPDLPMQLGKPPFYFSNRFLTDWVCSILLGLAILFFDQMRLGAVKAHVHSRVRLIADHTFSLYLYHYPILLFFSALFASHLASYPAKFAVGLATLALVGLLSIYTEGKRNWWRKMFDGIWGFAERKVAIGKVTSN